MEEIGKTGLNFDFEFLDLNDLDTQGLHLLKFDCATILIPKKSEYVIKKYFPATTLNKIDSDKEVAVEKCLIVLSDLVSTYYTDNKWKSLNSEILNNQTKKQNDNTFVYKYIIEALKKGSSNGSLIEVLKNELGKEVFIKGEQSKQYKISDKYTKSKLIRYKLKTEYLIERRRMHFFDILSTAVENTIGKNLINIYSLISIPTVEYLLAKGKSLSKDNYTTKKGKLLTVRNKHKNNYWTDNQRRSFVEDNIELFKYLTVDGFIIPNVGGQRSGGRVVDSFTLMPSWIRNEIKISGEETVEIDFKCLHPNIAASLYGGNKNYINHKEVSEKLKVDIKTVKIEHLSFFNKEPNEMKKSVLFDYYNQFEKWMLDNILKDKYENGYKITSYKMFAKETEIMTEVIKQLNLRGIYVVYVYDALLCKKSDYKVVKDVMNRVVIDKNVYTLAE